MSLITARQQSPVPHAVSVVIPCYNEAARLDRCRFRTYLAEPQGPHLLFVDDGSQDNTVAVLEDICRDFQHRASIFRCARNAGKGEAVRLGMLHAIRTFHPELVGFWDADLATPLDTIARFVDILNRTPHIEMIFGSRVKLLGRHVKRRALRHYLGRVFATAASLVLELPVYDTQCGAKLFRVSSGIENILKEPFLSKWVFDVEIIARYRRAFGIESKDLERVIYEYPLESWEDIAGSKVHASDFLVAVIDLLRIRAKYMGFARTSSRGTKTKW